LNDHDSALDDSNCDRTVAQHGSEVGGKKKTIMRWAVFEELV